MKAAVMYGPLDLRIEETEKPVPGKGEAVVKLKTTGICGSDIHFYDGTHPYQNYPRVYGHEMAGVIEKVSEENRNLKKGDKVVIEPLIGCGHCYPCRIGKYNCCINLKIIGANIDGGFAEYVAAPVDRIHEIPDSLPFDVACLCEPFSIGAQCVKRADVTAEDSVVLLGAGIIGQTILYFIRRIGAHIMVADISTFRLKLAEEHNPDALVNPEKKDLNEEVMQFTNGEGASVVIEATGVSKVMENAENLVASGGRIVIVGLTNDKVSFTGINFTKKEMTILGSRNNVNMFPYVIKTISSDISNVEKLITNRFPFNEIEKAFKYTSRNLTNVGKVVINFD